MLSHLYVLPAKRLSGSNVEHPHLRLWTPAVPAAAVPWYSRHGFLLYSKIQSAGLCSWYLGPLLLFWAFKKCKSGSSSSSDREGGAGAAPQAAAERKRPGRKIDPEAAELRASLERPFKRPGRNDLRSIFQTCWYSCWGDVFYIDTHSQSKQAADRYRAIAKFLPTEKINTLSWNRRHKQHPCLSLHTNMRLQLDGHHACFSSSRYCRTIQHMLC